MTTPLQMMRAKSSELKALEAPKPPPVATTAPPRVELTTSRGDAYTAAAVAGCLAELDQLRATPWVEKVSYWDANSHKVACRLIELANAGWNTYRLDQAEADFMAHAPYNSQWDERAAKWRAATNTIGSKPAAEPSGKDYEIGPVSVLDLDASAHVDAGDAGYGVAGASWKPAKLGKIVDGVVEGTIEPPKPTVGVFGDDAGALFYPGLVNGLAGHSGAGKSWVALLVVAQELAKGQTVLYLDYEDTPVGLVDRLVKVGVDPDAIRQHFIYISPEEQVDQVARSLLLDVVDERKPSFAVIDSTGESLALQGCSSNDGEDVAMWARILPRLLTKTGCTVLLLDHMAKAAEKDLWAVGSQRKRALIQGAQYILDAHQPFSQMVSGYSVIKCAKDRAGHYAMGEKVARLSVNQIEDGSPIIELTGEVDTGPKEFRPTGKMEEVSIALEASGEPLSFNQLNDSVTGKRATIRTAVDELIKDGFVTVADGPNRTTLHTLVNPFRALQNLREPLEAKNRQNPVVSGSGSYRGEPGTTHFTGSGNHSGTTGNHWEPPRQKPSLSTPPSGLLEDVDPAVCRSCKRPPDKHGLGSTGNCAPCDMARIKTAGR